MKRPSNKLIASGFLVLMSLVLMVSVSYAWFSLAGSPALAGIQINIGGTNTIRIAPDIVEEIDGKTVHFPGAFSDTFAVSEHSTYNYLEDSIGLIPVSTADGLHWFMPKAGNNVEIRGEASLSDYDMDDLLQYANVSVVDTEVEGREGSYVYLDFWVVSPMDNCNLRVSIGSEEEGSYVVALPEVTTDMGSSNGFRLDMEKQEIANCARLGFLVNTDDVQDNYAMKAYSDSDTYVKNYKKLKGLYQEKGSAIDENAEYRFTIYEPNGDLHNQNGLSYIQTSEGLTYTSCEDGDYVITEPIGYENGQPVLADISNILTVQKANRWKNAENGEALLTQIFQSFLVNRSTEGMTEKELMDAFYDTSLTDRYSEYVERGTFFDSTKLLYYSKRGNVVPQENMIHLEETTATRNAVIVGLERDVPQRIRMYVWLEGQDVDCVTDAAMQSFVVGLELAGSTQD